MGKPYSRVHLRIGGDGVDPKVCSEILGVLPDKQWKKGDPWMGGGWKMHEKHIGLWKYHAEKHVQNDDPYDPLPLVNHTIQIFAGKRALFDQIRNTMRGSISMSITMGASSVSYELDRRLLETILDMGIDDINCTFIGIEEEEEEEKGEEGKPLELWSDCMVVKLFNQTEASVWVEVNGSASNVGAGLWSRDHHTPIANHFEIILYFYSAKQHMLYGIDIPSLTSYSIILTLSKDCKLTGSMLAPSAADGGAMIPVSVQLKDVFHGETGDAARHSDDTVMNPKNDSGHGRQKKHAGVDMRVNEVIE
jgi:hypothetical protein